MPHRFLNFLLDLIFPWQCVFCQKEVEADYPLCQYCFQQILIFDDFLCPICQKRLSGINQKHFSCQRKTHLAALGVVSLYENPILKETIHYFKYKQIKSLVQPLSLLTIKFLENSFYFSQLPKNNLLIIPLPLHLRKEKQRGFNQSKLIAKKVAEYFHLPLENQILFRTVNNPAQVTMKNANDRKLNIQGVFQVNNENNLKHKTIILIDDIYTTGATMEEAAKILKENGAKKVIGLVLARG
ncbi:MAG: ComF family protein [Candidatus Paceibacterota bacterium]|jgi:ComF family protein